VENKRTERRWLWWFTLILASIILYRLFSDPVQLGSAIGWIIGILTPFIGGLALSFLLLPPSRWLEAFFGKRRNRWIKKLARPLSIVTVYLALFGVVILVVSLVIPRLVASVSGLVKELPGYLESAKSWLASPEVSEGFFGSLDLHNLLGNLSQAVGDAVVKMLTTENVVSALQGVLNVTNTILDAVICLIVSVYMLAGREKLLKDVKAVLSLFMRRDRISTLGGYGHRIGTIFYRYLYGAFLDALAVGVVVSVGLLIFRVPYAVLLGMLLGLLNMIPYFGALFGGIFVVLIALLSCNLYTALGVLAYILIIQQLDANILQPRVVGDSVGLRPIYVLLGVTFFGGLLGFWGVFLGVPLMAVIQMLVKEAIAAKAKKQNNP